MSTTQTRSAKDPKPSDAVEVATDEAKGSGLPRPTGIKGLIDWVLHSKPVRVFQNYGNNGGPLLASGMSYQAVFAIFAALAAAFSIFGLALANNPQLQAAIFEQINTSVPGLIGPDGAIHPDSLTNATPALGWTGVIAIAGLIFTAVGFLGSTRSAIRLIFNLPGPKTNFVLLKLKDFGLAIAFAILLLISAALSIASSSALGFVFGLFGWDQSSVAGQVIARVVGLLVVYVFDTIVLAGVYRILSGVPIPFRQLAPGAALGAVVMGVLKVLGSSLLGGATSNPLLASFAVIIGILIWFNLICQVLLIFASWIEVSMQDAHVDPRNLTPEQAEREALQAEAEAHRTALAAQRTQVTSELERAHGLRRSNLRRALRRLDRELAREPAVPVIDPSSATPPPK
ncbi:YihY/virulence factor BrkB family protein [Subtercola endophyticus]|uniref:YihY/virulence factor BrkB family protein n=1 Tax=Subtercola endophyticus TaxID=2895559 RepID=UPI001E64CFA1|nr:YihY/virulence factor BrkB family protein [Subtercola endophyticus]UFS57794.1 YihY/virulence factor BrkB family protein [Subtercola endophyticus]